MERKSIIVIGIRDTEVEYLEQFGEVFPLGGVYPAHPTEVRIWRLFVPLHQEYLKAMEEEGASIVICD